MSLRLRYDPTMDHYDVLTGSWVCGIIQHKQVADDYPPWRWIIQLGGDVPEGAEFDDYAQTLGEATVAFARNWRIWLECAGLREEDTLDAPPAANSP